MPETRSPIGPWMKKGCCQGSVVLKLNARCQLSAKLRPCTFNKCSYSYMLKARQHDAPQPPLAKPGGPLEFLSTGSEAQYYRASSFRCRQPKTRALSSLRHLLPLYPGSVAIMFKIRLSNANRYGQYSHNSGESGDEISHHVISLQIAPNDVVFVAPDHVRGAWLRFAIWLRSEDAEKIRDQSVMIWLTRPFL